MITRSGIAGSSRRRSGGGHGVSPEFVGEDHFDNGGITSFDITTSIASGQTVIVKVAVALGTVTSITDTGGSIYTLLRTETGTRTMEIWGALSALASTSVTVNFNGSVVADASVERWTGVSAFGNVNGGSNASSASISLSGTMQDTNNVWCVGILTLNSNLQTAVTGIIRLNNYGANQGSLTLTTITHTSGLIGALSIATTIPSPDNWTAAGVELRSV